jgi:hypothetical protein
MKFIFVKILSTISNNNRGGQAYLKKLPQLQAAIPLHALCNESLTHIAMQVLHAQQSPSA